MKILAIESSCDETSASILIDGIVKSNIISSQVFHTKYGGVVPELASRAHLKSISEITNSALKEANTSIKDIDAIAVTSEPGLIGSLIVGANFAKGLSIKYGIPIVPVNHIEGHLYSGHLEDPSLGFPIISLVVSGGHTAIFHVKSFNEYEIVGLTRDDAAGEAFDKVAKLIGLGYPGGPIIDKLAKNGNPKKYDFPRPMLHDKHYDFSFSGLKTSVRYFIHKNFPKGLTDDETADICASVQAAIVEVLVKKTVKAARDKNVSAITISGGVSANSALRQEMSEHSAKYNIKTITPNMEYCLDNAAMIGNIADKKISESNKQNYFDLTFTVNPSSLRAAR